MHDIYSKSAVTLVLPHQVVKSDVDGNPINLQGYNHALLIVTVGKFTDGSTQLGLEESDDGIDWRPVSSDHTQGEFPAIESTEAGDQCYQFGYIGPSTYIRVTIKSAGASKGLPCSVTALLGYPRYSRNTSFAGS